jgi:hypothetical protein
MTLFDVEELFFAVAVFVNGSCYYAKSRAKELSEA